MARRVLLPILLLVPGRFGGLADLMGGSRTPRRAHVPAEVRVLLPIPAAWTEKGGKCWGTPGAPGYNCVVQGWSTLAPDVLLAEAGRRLVGWEEDSARVSVTGRREASWSRGEQSIALLAHGPLAQGLVTIAYHGDQHDVVIRIGDDDEERRVGELIPEGLVPGELPPPLAALPWPAGTDVIAVNDHPVVGLAHLRVAVDPEALFTALLAAPGAVEFARGRRGTDHDLAFEQGDRLVSLVVRRRGSGPHDVRVDQSPKPR
ncbi:MAG: hypothetical protein H6732_14100 [Alphaproteobacteria bacterium]|nr:hypothetical protein [Alphaproteobacteria bacterium]